MIRHRIHTSSKIFFPDPYMVRVEYDLPGDYDKHGRDFHSLVRATYRLIKGTWGYSNLEEEQTDGFTPPGASSEVQLSLLFDGNLKHKLRGYFAFKDEMDALQFRLSIDTTSVQVKMWPARQFTIHEYAEVADNTHEE